MRVRHAGDDDDRKAGRPAAWAMSTAGLMAVASCAGAPEAEEAPSAAVTPTGGEVLVVETEFALEVTDPVPPGATTLLVRNDGDAVHDLAISGPGVEAVSETVQPGQVTRLEVELAPGRYTLWCTVGNHRAQGMEGTLDVVG